MNRTLMVTQANEKSFWNQVKFLSDYQNFIRLSKSTVSNLYWRSIILINIFTVYGNMGCGLVGTFLTSSGSKISDFRPSCVKLDFLACKLGATFGRYSPNTYSKSVVKIFLAKKWNFHYLFSKVCKQMVQTHTLYYNIVW